MFKDNLSSLRKMKKLSQEDLAEKLDISRQTLSKWETGEAVPDIEKCKTLADIFEVSLDDLVSYEVSDTGLPLPPKGKHIFGVVTVGEKGQIVIPAKARKIFSITSGDQLVVLGDENQGLALLKSSDFINIAEQIRKSMDHGS
ncbi:MAG: helix-turn-helix transcriptional regulator [Lachnospiraceae bacterium]|nr:helix-turn-helix transcriptional regulator [Lachnospiraceae bacterium]